MKKSFGIWMIIAGILVFTPIPFSGLIAGITLIVGGLSNFVK